MKSGELRGATTSMARGLEQSPVTGVLAVRPLRGAISEPASPAAAVVKVSPQQRLASPSLYARDGRVASAARTSVAAEGESASVHIKARVRASVASESTRSAPALDKLSAPAVVERTAREAALHEARRLTQASE